VRSYERNGGAVTALPTRIARRLQQVVAVGATSGPVAMPVRRLQAETTVVATPDISLRLCEYGGMPSTEAGTGIEPICATVQVAASPLCYPALLELIIHPDAVGVVRIGQLNN
jgi:hypothetical protein